MAIITDIVAFKSGYMGKYTNDTPTPASETVQITIDGTVLQPHAVEIPANDFVCLFGNWSSVNTSISHEICAKIEKISKTVTFLSVPENANVEIIT